MDSDTKLFAYVWSILGIIVTVLILSVTTYNIAEMHYYTTKGYTHCVLPGIGTTQWCKL